MSKRQLPRLDLRRLVQFLVAMSVIGYTIALCVWYLLRLQFGDAHPGLALANTIALYLFTPLVLLIPLAALARRLSVFAILLFPLALFLVLFGSQFLPPTRKFSTDKSTLRVMTFNVFGNSDHPERATTLIESENPDIVLIQELSPRHSFDLTGTLGTRYPHRQFEPFFGRRGIGILSKFAVASDGWLKLGRDPYAAQQVSVDWEGHEIHLFNVHLESTMPSENVSASFRERETQVRQLLEIVSRKAAPTIVAGDLNLTDTTEAYATLTRGLNDAHRQAGWGLGLTIPTNPAFVRAVAASSAARLFQTHTRAISPWLESVYIPPLPLLRIDYILTTSELTATNSYVTPWDGQSDHRAVIADLQIQTP